MKERKFLPINKLFPNIITLMGLCFGLTSIKYTLIGKWELAVTFITIAAIIDGMDGRIARLLDSTSEFGAQLDSLADFLNFGVAPALLLYFWELHNTKVYGWALVTLMVICMAIRLARFNTPMNDKDENRFFVGVPAPFGALLSLVPIIISFDEEMSLYHLSSNEMMIYILIICILVVSRIPTFSLKIIHIPKNLISLVMFFFGLLMIFLITEPWLTLTMISVLYVISIPITAVTSFYLQYKSSQ